MSAKRQWKPAPASERTRSLREQLDYQEKIEQGSAPTAEERGPAAATAGPRLAQGGGGATATAVAWHPSAASADREGSTTAAAASATDPARHISVEPGRALQAKPPANSDPRPAPHKPGPAQPEVVPPAPARACLPLRRR